MSAATEVPGCTSTDAALEPKCRGAAPCHRGEANESSPPRAKTYHRAFRPNKMPRPSRLQYTRPLMACMRLDSLKSGCDVSTYSGAAANCWMFMRKYGDLFWSSTPMNITNSRLTSVGARSCSCAWPLDLATTTAPKRPALKSANASRAGGGVLVDAACA